jgi:hypothetical protein
MLAWGSGCGRWTGAKSEWAQVTFTPLTGATRNQVVRVARGVVLGFISQGPHGRGTRSFDARPFSSGVGSRTRRPSRSTPHPSANCASSLTTSPVCPSLGVELRAPPQEIDSRGMSSRRRRRRPPLANEGRAAGFAPRICARDPRHIAGAPGGQPQGESGRRGAAQAVLSVPPDFILAEIRRTRSPSRVTEAAAAGQRQPGGYLVSNRETGAPPLPESDGRALFPNKRSAPAVHATRRTPRSRREHPLPRVGRLRRTWSAHAQTFRCSRRHPRAAVGVSTVTRDSLI